MLSRTRFNEGGCRCWCADWTAGPAITMKQSLFASLALASVLSLGAFGCAWNHEDSTADASQEVHTSAKSIAATTETRFTGGVWAVKGIDNQPGMQLAMIEFGGG